MFHVAGATGRDHGNPYETRNRTCQLAIVTRACAVAIHARQEDLACAEFFSSDGPFNRITFNSPAPAVRVNFPTSFIASACINRDDDALASESLGTIADQLRIFECGSVER